MDLNKRNITLNEIKENEVNEAPLIIILFFQPLSRPFTKLFVDKTNISPNMITILGGLLVYISLILLFINPFPVLSIPILLILNIGFTFDIVDGVVARITNKTSDIGGWLDSFVFARTEDMIYLFMCLNLLINSNFNLTYLLQYTIIFTVIKLLNIIPSLNEGPHRFSRSFFPYIIEKIIKRPRFKYLGEDRAWILSNFYIALLYPLFSIFYLFDALNVLYLWATIFLSMDYLLTMMYLKIYDEAFEKIKSERITGLKTSKYIASPRTISKILVAIFCISWILLIYSYFNQLSFPDAANIKHLGIYILSLFYFSTLLVIAVIFRKDLE